MVETIENIVCAIIIGTFVCYFVYEIFIKKPKPIRKQDESRILFNAHVSETNISEEEVFRILEDNNVSFNYLENDVNSN